MRVDYFEPAFESDVEVGFLLLAFQLEGEIFDATACAFHQLIETERHFRSVLADVVGQKGHRIAVVSLNSRPDDRPGFLDGFGFRDAGTADGDPHGDKYSKLGS